MGPRANSSSRSTSARNALLVVTPSATVSSSARASRSRASSRVRPCAITFAIIES